MAQKKIWEKDGLYCFLRPYVDLCTRLSYRSFKKSGSLPEDGAVFITPNHTGTLMDALVVLASRRPGTAFGARADIFRKPRTARILHWLKIVPMVRARDGIREVQRNRETMEVVEDILAHGMPFCMFPEGRHNPMHSLLPLQKGIARMAFASAEVRQTWIVPTGIEYDDFFHYRSTCALRYGEPIDVNAFLASHADLSEADQYRQLLQELSDRIKGLILYIPDDENYEENLLKARPPCKRWWKWPLVILGFPFWLAAAILTLPLWGTAEYISFYKIKDPAFRNTVRFALRVLGIPLFLIIWALLAFLLLNPWIAAGVLVYYLFSYSIFYDGLNLVR